MTPFVNLSHQQDGGLYVMQSVPFLLFPMLVISKYKKQNTLRINGPRRQLFHLYSHLCTLLPYFCMEKQLLVSLSVQKVQNTKQHFVALLSAFQHGIPPQSKFNVFLKILKAKAGCSAVSAPRQGSEGSLQLQGVRLLRSNFLVSSFHCFSSFQFLIK